MRSFTVGKPKKGMQLLSVPLSEYKIVYDNMFHREFKGWRVCCVTGRALKRTSGEQLPVLYRAKQQRSRQYGEIYFFILSAPLLFCSEEVNRKIAIYLSLDELSFSC